MRKPEELVREVTRPVGLMVLSVISAATMWLADIAPLVVALFAVMTILPSLALLAIRGQRRAWVLLRHSRQQAEQAAEAERHYFEVLRRIVAVVDARDASTAGRGERIARLSRQMAERLALPTERVELLGMVAEVHDIGLLAVPGEVCVKRGRLATDDFDVIRQHPQTGYEILRPLQFLQDVLPAVRHHHERLNGTGYPSGLTGRAIEIEARVLAVAEAFEALTHDRPNRRALSAAQAVNELVHCADAGYDRDCIRALADAVNMSHLLPTDWCNQMAPQTLPVQPTLAIGA